MAASEHVNDLAVWVDGSGYTIVVLPARALTPLEEIDLRFTSEIATQRR